ncbi:MAG: extracellular solute-binding protein [Lachnospiraceae bacterium]|nr:extracellular solute-binding protein [Lachnospiraceae bacterium]
MKKHFRPTVTLLMIILITVSILSGCGSTSGNTDTATPSGAGTTDSAAAGETTQTADDEFFNRTGYPIVNTPYEMDIMHVRFEGHGEEFKDNQWFAELQEKTNVNLNWITPTANAFTEQKAIMFASGDLPGVIYGSNGFTDDDIINNIGYFLPLNDLIDEFMPNLKRAFELQPELKAAVTHLDGNIYSLPSLISIRAAAGAQPIINKTWLDNLGLAAPETTDELYDVLYAFKNNDPKGDGSLVIPFTGGASDATTFFAEGPISTFFGARGNHAEGLGVRNGVVTFAPVTLENREAIQFMRKMFENGLMDNEFYTQSWGQSFSKRVDSEQALVGFELGWTPDASFGQWADQYIVIAPPARPDGQRFSGQMPGKITRNEFMITVFCEYPEIAARWADEFFTIEASLQNLIGPVDGRCMEITADGTWREMPPTPEEDVGMRSWRTATVDYGPKFFPDNYEDFGIKLELYPEGGNMLKLAIQEIAMPYIDPAEEFPNLAFYTPEQTEIINAHRADIRTLVNYTLAKWVSHGGIEHEWDTFIEQLESVGYYQWLNAHQEAYDAYMANMN